MLEENFQIFTVRKSMLNSKIDEVIKSEAPRSQGGAYEARSGQKTLVTVWRKPESSKFR